MTIIHETIKLVEERLKPDLRAVVHGGAARDLYLNNTLPVEYDTLVEPKDVDFVSNGTLGDLVPRFPGARVTGLGGLRFGKSEGFPMAVDIWPLQDTWAYKHGVVVGVDKRARDEMRFEDLLKTCFFNIEAIIYLPWVTGPERFVFSAAFERGFRDKVLEVNLEPNPAPALQIVRAIVLCKRYGFSIGPKLRRFMRENKQSINIFERIQRTYYGRLVLDKNDLREWIE